MSTVTRKLFTLGKRLAIGLVVGLLAQQALADEVIVRGSSASAGVGVDQKVFRAALETYIRSVNDELKTAVDRGLKRDAEPKVEIASAAQPAHG